MTHPDPNTVAAAWSRVLSQMNAATASNAKATTSAAEVAKHAAPGR